jgi:serine/threonine protein kinase
VQTRWYRSPEVILLEPNYDSKIDVWSIGCIFAELIKFEMNNGTPMSNSKIALFPGRSCIPISPSSSTQEWKQGQLNLILQIFSPSSQSIKHASKEGKKVVNCILENIEEFKSMDKLFSLKVDPKLLSLLKKMIVFDPKERLSAKQLLQDPIFDSIRDPRNQRDAPF